MGADIHTHAEQYRDGRWVKVAWTEGAHEYAFGPFDWRAYGLYGWLADVRNYSAVPVLVEPRGLPEDISEAVRDNYGEWEADAHSASWLSVDELLAFDYDQEFEDRRVTRNGDGGVTAEPGDGEMTTYRKFLGRWFSNDLNRLRELNEQAPTRVVFWFDN